MDIVVTTDLAHVAREIGLPVEQVKLTVELLDEGNTVPFITRYRKDQTGGFDEEQIRQIQLAVTKARMLAERKQTILKSIDSQGKLTKEMAGQIKGAQSTKRLEDLYLPYKPKKQTLATTARQRGLAPLAEEVLAASPLAADLDLRAGDYMNPDTGLVSRADVLLGVGHILAEMVSERAELRSKLRKILRATGTLVSTRAAPAEEATSQATAPATGGEPPASSTASSDEEAKPADPAKKAEPAQDHAESPPATPPPTTEDAPPATGDAEPGPEQPEPGGANESEAAVSAEPQAAEPATAPETTEQVSEPAPEPSASDEPAAVAFESVPEQATENPPVQATEPPPEKPPEQPPEPPPEPPPEQAPENAADQTTEPQTAEAPTPPSDQTAESPAGSDAEQAAESPGDVPPPAAEGAAAGTVTSASQGDDEGASEPATPPDARMPSVAQAVPAPSKVKSPEQSKKDKKKKSKKEKAREKKEKSFKDYFDFREDLSRLLPHRILAINRGERAKVLRVRIECDVERMVRDAEDLLVTPEHPHRDFLCGVVRDALTRLVVPALEREVRRELTDRAEGHAVEVFARNLRHLLLGRPLQGRRVLAIDPGFRSGCKMAAIDEFGNVLGHGVIHLVGREERRRKARYRVTEMIRLHRLSVVAIGNGTACREVEQLVAEVIADDVKDLDVAYCVVNEAGASVYSTSGLGREELPDYDATLRSAISIGRRLLDPLSELVKINPSNIGVGLYQHDVKAKHLRESLDAVVESCVNYVGVDVNTASPALLRHVSGLNQLTARRLYDFRLQNGPFKSREQLKNVPGFGTATFVQAAGFLKISGGENPLDATSIHPESYDAARRVLEEVNSSVSDLSVDREAVTPPATSGDTAPAVPSAQTPPVAATEAETAATATEDSPQPEPAPTAVAEPPQSESPSTVVAAVAETAEAPAAPEIAPDAVPTDAGETNVAGEAEPSLTPPAEEQQPAAPPSDELPQAPAETTPTGTADEETPSEAAAPSPEEQPPAEQAAAEPASADRPSPEQPAAEPTAEPQVGETTPAAEVETSPATAGDQDEPPTLPAAEPATESVPPHVDLAKRVAEVDSEALSGELGIGKLLLEDILAALARPGRDPREALPQPIFRRGIVKLDDLEAGMELKGTVLNVVDFGVFVDIGLNDSALIHVSRLADRYVRDPHDVVSVGDIILVWVVDVDKQRRRVSLTAIKPGTQRKPAERRGKRDRDQKKPSGPPRERAAAKRAAQRPQSKAAGGRGRPPRPRAKPEYKPKRKPKPVVPITKAMKEGREPMRAFSDLQQFFTTQEEKPAEEPPKDDKSSEEKPNDSQENSTS